MAPGLLVQPPNLTNLPPNLRLSQIIVLASGCVIKCLEQPFTVNPLSVSIQRTGKKRLILDLRIPNKYFWKQSVKYEDLRTALVLFF